LLSNTFKTYADEEDVNENMNEGMQNMAKIVTEVADHLDITAKRFDAKVFLLFSTFSLFLNIVCVRTGHSGGKSFGQSM